MKKPSHLMLLLFIFVFLFVGAYLLYDQLSKEHTPDQLLVRQTQESAEETIEDQSSAPREEIKAPDFTVYDGEGNAVRLSDFQGKPVVLNFWASWCGPCQREMPDFQEKYLSFGEDVHFLMVNATGGRETLESAKQFIADKGYTFPVFFDTETEAAAAYSVYSLPTTYFIDADGYLIAQATGAIDAETLQYGLDLLQ